jgi:Trypsin-like peptidase domain
MALALVLLVFFPACSAVTHSTTRIPLNTTEQMMWSTYLIGSPKGMGAGFVVFRRDPSEPDGVVPVMVTAGHLLDAVGKGPLLIGTRMPDATGGAQVALIEFQPKRGSQRFYVRHPDHDIAAFEMHIPKEAASVVALPSFVNVTARDGKQLRAGEEVSFVGFPEMLPEMEGLFPVLRTGRIASYPIGSAQTGGLFIINADVYPGDSGAPVYVVGRRGRPELAGMIIRRVGTDRKAFSHFAIAVDSKAIHETLQLLETGGAKSADEEAAGRSSRAR